MRISDWSSDVCSSDLVRRLRNVLRNQDVIGRVGGEEFLALLPGADQRAALEIADRLLDVMRETPIRHDDVNVAMTLSVGVAALGGHDVQLVSLLPRAGAALDRTSVVHGARG